MVLQSPRQVVVAASVVDRWVLGPNERYLPDAEVLPRLEVSCRCCDAILSRLAIPVEATLEELEGDCGCVYGCMAARLEVQQQNAARYWRFLPQVGNEEVLSLRLPRQDERQVRSPAAPFRLRQSASAWLLLPAMVAAFPLRSSPTCLS